MRLDELTAAEVPGLRGVSPIGEPVEITSLAYDSRRVGPGTLFFCVAGHRQDGHDFAAAAVAAGAAALVVERSLGLGVPELVVESSRAAMGPLAARFYGEPTAELRVVGVTAPTARPPPLYLVRALLEAAGERCGLLGTVKSRVGGVERPAPYHTRGVRPAGRLPRDARRRRARAARWRCPRTRSRLGAPTACASLPPCSPTSPRTTSTSTTRWRTTSRPSGACSCPRRRRGGGRGDGRDGRAIAPAREQARSAPRGPGGASSTSTTPTGGGSPPRSSSP